MKGSFSSRALDQIKSAIANGRQAMVLQNRKGYASYLECEDCHHIPHCPNCDVSLTYFKQGDELKCRYCGEQYPNSPQCPNGHNAYKTVGGGTEKIEEELSLLLPELRIIRIDSEAISGKKETRENKAGFCPKPL